MTNEIVGKYASLTVHLVSCAVKGTKPEAGVLDDLDMKLLFDFANYHRLSAAVGMVLERMGVNDPTFHEAYSKTIRNQTLRDMECEKVYAALEKAGIWYMPMKGVVLKELYPFGIREMSDADILIDPALAEKARDIMIAAGYTVEDYGVWHHDEYVKPPIYSVELHREMIHPGFEDDTIYDYYANVKERLIPCGGMRFCFSPEDEYIFMVVHEYKHYKRGGTGLRSLLDVYLFLQKYGDALDFDYISAECEKLSVADFEKQNRRVALSLYGEGEVDEQDREFYDFIVSSGMCGTVDNIVEAKVQSGGRFKYIRERLFLPMTEVRLIYPFFYRHKILLPALFFYRIGKMLTVKSGAVLAEIKRVFKYKKK